MDFALKIDKYWRRMLIPDIVDLLKIVTSQNDFKTTIADFIGIKRLIADEKDVDKRKELFDMEENFINKYAQ